MTRLLEDMLRSEFETGFQDILNMTSEIKLFVTTFSVHVDSIKHDLQMEIIDLQNNTDLKDKFQHKELMTD